MQVTVGPIHIAGPGLLIKTGDEPFEYVHVPDPIEATIDDAEWDVHMTIRIDEVSLEPYIDELIIRRKANGPKVNPDMIRGLRLGEAIREAVRQSSAHWVQDGNVMRLDWDRVPREMVAAAFKRPKRSVTTDDIRAAADAYDKATKEGRRDRIIAVADACHVSRATAHRRISKAKQLGLIREETI
jgi:hypothetical protein